VKITVIAVDQDEVALVRGTSALGWRGRFGCPLVVGEVVFIPARGLEDNLRAGNHIQAETGHEEISHFKVNATAAESMQPLELRGDYLVRGLVVHVAPQGMIRVSVRGLEFALERDELGGANPKNGDHVEFHLHGLSLWDTGE
jgi:hypothetical protein